MTISLLAISAIASARHQSPIQLTWQDLGPTTEGTWRNCFTIKNISTETLHGDWLIYYNQLPRTASKIETNQITITTINRNYFCIAPTSQFKPLKAGEELKVYYQSNRRVPNVSWAPEEAFFVSTRGGKQHKPIKVELNLIKPEGLLRQETIFADSTFKHNEEIGKAQGKVMNTLPTVKDMLMLTNTIGADLNNGVSINAEKSLLHEGEMLKENLKQQFGISIKKRAQTSINLRIAKLQGNLTPLQHTEQYTLEVKENSITITAETAHGVFNGTQTLLSLLKKDGGQKALEPMLITDYPDLKYRGILLDIARNFIPVKDIRKIIDALSAYKINHLQLHFADDEGWRLQIPGLEELTEVGARRGYTTDEQQCLYPAYGGGFDSKHSSVGTGFITRAEFISLLRYVAERHVTILPEVESPGHCRAACKSMLARYNKYKERNPEKASEYLLTDLNDTLRRTTPAAYDDEALNPALPSTYRFMEKVIDEIGKMYTEAGLKLNAIHLGGDEVARNAWTGSTIAKQLANNEGFKSVSELHGYYFARMANWLKTKDIKLCGWQEMAMEHNEAEDSIIRNNTGAIYVWSADPTSTRGELPYTIANKGYPVILGNANNLYIDFAYTPLYNDRGHIWGGYLDEHKSFSLLPYNVYRSARTNMKGERMNLDSLEHDRVTLTEEGRANIIGVQTQLFSETLRSAAWFEYYIFPKMLGMAERGWNANPEWETMRGENELQAFNADLNSFYKWISLAEMPWLSRKGIHFHLMPPGIAVRDGKLFINSRITGATLRYTLDGSEPTATSEQWTAPVIVPTNVTIRAKVFYLNKESLPVSFVQSDKTDN